MATNFPSSLDVLANPSSGDTLASPSHSGQHTDANDAIEALQAKVGIDGSAVTTSIDYKLNNTVATKAGTETLQNKTLTSPVINTPTVNDGIVKSIEERWGISSTVLGTSQAANLNSSTSTAWYFTSNPTGNFTVNFNQDSSLDTTLVVGDSITYVMIVNNGTTPYYPTSYVTGGTATLYWQGGTAPTSGNASARDVYVYTVIKRSTATYDIFASRTLFS